MSRRRASVSSGIVLSLVVIGGLAWSLFGWQARANTAPDLLLPAKPVFLYTFDGFQGHQEAWEATAAQRALIESGLLKVVNKLLDFAVQESGEPSAELVQKMVTRAFERGGSLAVAVDKSGAMPSPQVTLLLHGSADFEAKLTSLLMAGPLQTLTPKQETIAGRKVTRLTIPDTPDYEVGWWSDGGHVVIVFGGNAVSAALDIAQGKSPNLSTNAIVKVLRTSKDFQVASVSLIDTKALLDLVANLEIPASPDSGKPGLKVADGLKILGLDRLGMLKGRWGFRGEAIWSEALLEAPAPRTGLLSLIEHKHFSLAELPPLPKGCDHFAAFKLDFSQFGSTLLGMVDKGFELFGPAGIPTPTQHVARASEHIGFHPLNDLVDPLGDTVVSYVDPSASAVMPAFAVLLSVDDSKKLQSTLDLLEEKAKQLGENVTFRAKELNGRSIHVLHLPAPLTMFSPSWVIDKGWLVVGSTPQTVEAHIKRVDGKLPKWEPTPEVATALKALPPKFSSFSYSDPRVGIRSLLALAPTGISLAEIGMVEWRKMREQSGKKVDDSAEFPITAEDVPIAEEVVGPLFPNLTASMVNEEGVHWYARNSLPGLPIPGSGGGGVESVGTVAVLVALLLPAVQQAREAARRTASRNNLRQLGLAMHNHHDQHRALPAGTYPNAKLKPEERLSWMIALLPYLEEEDRFKQVDLTKGWKDKANEGALKSALSLNVTLNPSQPIVQPVNGYAITHYVGIAGVGKDAPTLPITDNRVGMFGYDRKTTFADVRDGLSNTLMITDASKDFGPWAQGGAVTIRAFTTKPYVNGPDGIGSPHVGGFQALLGDGSVRFISKEIDPTLLEALSTIHGDETIGDF